MLKILKFRVEISNNAPLMKDREDILVMLMWLDI